MDTHVRGACQCKRVSYKVALPIGWSGFCACTQCQKIHGAPFATWCEFNTPDVQIIDPEKMFATYNTGRADRGFCKNCGSSFYFKFTDAAYIEKYGSEVVFFTPETFDEKIDVTFDEVIFHDDLPGWMDQYDRLPKKGGTALK